MGRILKRVPMDFNWPLKQVWGGYRNPYYALAGKCADCENGFDRAGGRPDANAALFNEQWYGSAPFDPFAYGAKVLPFTQEHPAFLLATRNVDHAPDYYTPRSYAARERFKRDAMTGLPHDEPIVVVPGIDPVERHDEIEREARRLYELWRYQWCHHLIQADVDALVADDRLWDFTRRPRTPEQEAQLERQVAHGGSGWWLEESNGHHPTADEVNLSSFLGMGHDAINNSSCVRARCLREGVPYECATCKGTGKIWPSREIEQKCEDWVCEDPPTGDGFQLWENTSEGSPVSPVFATLDELCAWAEVNATTFGTNKATKAEWMEMLGDGFVHAKLGDNIILM